MSALIGISDREIAAVADAFQVLSRLRHVVGSGGHSETIDTLGKLLERISPRYGAGSTARNGQDLLAAIRALLPEEEEDE